MLDRTDFVSWQQRIRLYCRGKENGVNILKSIDERPFQMETFQETLAEGNEGALHLGPERPRTAGYGGAQNRVGNANPGQARQDFSTQLLYSCSSWMTLLPFDSDVGEAPTAQTMFMANLSSADPVYDESGPSYDSDILSKVQPNYVVDSHADYTSDRNMILYDQYVKDNAMPVVQSNVSSVPNDAYMMIYNDMYEPHAQSISKTTWNTIVDNSLTAELATYKEQVELYERWARFELTKREQKIDEQLRIVITDRNIKEENLKKELHSIKIATWLATIKP
ncbi:hypothetical protein Tco_0344644 [Tanacetum coccineum]